MQTKKEQRFQLIQEFLASNPNATSGEIYEGSGILDNQRTIQRALVELVENGVLLFKGQGRGTRYFINPLERLFVSFDMEKYFNTPMDDRTIIDNFNIEMIHNIRQLDHVFSSLERDRVNKLQFDYIESSNQLSETIKLKNFEVLSIDLIWKSSQIEGNTYNLLETEFLIKEGKKADKKTQEEATMILNHKKAIDYILADTNDVLPLTRRKIETIHELLTQELGINAGIRDQLVRVGGTNYSPMGIRFQIEEAIDSLCEAINERDDPFEQAFLATIFLSYIQPFDDGNKRTARITGNALLMASNCCPISYRTVDSSDYKKAMLLFYEQNSIMAFKEIFVDQYDFAVNHYFG